MISTKATTHSSAGHLAELSVSRMVRSVLQAPLALLLVLLMLPKVPFLAPLSLVPKAQAAWPVDPGSWERGVVAGYLTALGLPESDVDMVQQYGRADLRDDVRALLLTKYRLFDDSAEITHGHEILRDAIQQGDGDYAAILLERHVIDTHEAIVQSLAHERAKPAGISAAGA